MTCVYLDQSALYLRRGASTVVLDPEAGRIVAMLQDDGHDVVLVGDDACGELAYWVSRLPISKEACPERTLNGTAWLIVGDRTRCRSRVGGLRTVLVGGGVPMHAVGRRCDIEVADLFTAALTVIGAGSIPENVS